ncbi:polyprenyl synthetase family protein [Corynebacterium kroppenstedtii]|uniref:polyprenyl synthetase family protein n=1 Tax=Corynebacterium sp. PCR 32 TaxID=3351342 RepID=UPI0030B558A0
MSGGFAGLNSRSVESSLDLGDDELNSFVADGMEKCEKLLIHELDQGASFVTDKIKHLALAGGKRVRPMFALLASRYGEKPGCDDVVKAAIVVEMTHLATLYHDDVMDEAEKRRGSDSANFRWNNSVAILAGDFILSTASRLMASLGVPTVKHFSEAFGDLVTGQMRETVGATSGDEIDHYLTVIREKTAVLIRSAGFLGAMHAGTPAPIQQALATFGEHLGMVFQIVDDMIDIFSDSRESGKTPGTDLREGVHTLPMLYAMDGDRQENQRLREMLQSPLATDAEVQEALALIAATDARARTVEKAQEHADAAVRALESLPDNSATDALRALLAFTMARVG